MQLSLPLSRFAALVALFCLIAIGCSGDPDKQYTDFLASGKSYMESGEYSRALLQFRSAAKVKPKDAEAMFQMGKAYLADQKIREAYQSFLKATELDPEHAEAQAAVAEILVALGTEADVDNARSRLENILAVNPANSDARFILAAAKAKTDREAAEEELVQTLENFPQHLKSSVALAAIRINERNFEEARTILQKAVAEDPKSPEAHTALGQFRLVMNELDGAKEEFEKALAIDPKNVGALAAQARLLLIQNKPDEAGELYKRISQSGNKQFKAVYGRFLIGMRRFDDASTEFERLYNADTNDREMRTALVATYRLANRQEEAEAVLAKALERNSADYQARLQRAELRMAAGDLNGASEDIATVLDVNETSAEAHYLMARVYLAQGQRLQGRQELNEVMRLDEKLLTPRIELANLLVTEKSSDAALNLLNAAPEPGAASDKLRLAIAKNWVELQMGRKDVVRARLAKNLEDYPNSADLKLQDAILTLDKREFSAARKLFEEVLAVNPGEVRAVNGLGWTYSAQGDVNGAIAAIKKHVDSAPPSAILAANLGTWYTEVDKPEDARKYLESAAQIDPNFIPAQLQLAVLDVKQNREGPALERLNKVVAAAPTNIEAQVMLGQLQEKLGNTAAAMESYRAIITADSDNFRALNNLAYHLANDPDTLDEALGYAQRAKEAEPGNAFVDDTIGWCYYKKGNYRTAVEYFERASKALEMAQVKYHLAMAYAQTGELENARAAFQQGRALDPAAEEAQTAETLIARVSGSGQ